MSRREVTISMCWMRQTKIKIPATVTRPQAADAVAPEAPVMQATKSWETTSKKKGASALKIDPVTMEDSIKKTRASGVNYFNA